MEGASGGIAVHVFTCFFFNMLLIVYGKARHANPGLHCYPYWDENSSLLFPSLPSFSVCMRVHFPALNLLVSFDLDA